MLAGFVPPSLVGRPYSQADLGGLCARHRQPIALGELCCAATASATATDWHQRWRTVIWRKTHPLERNELCSIAGEVVSCQGLDNILE